MLVEATPAVVVTAVEVNTSLLAFAAFTVNWFDVAPVSAPSLAVSVFAVPAVVGSTALKVATPFTADTVNVLPPVNPVVPLPIVTLLLLFVTTFPLRPPHTLSPQG